MESNGSTPSLSAPKKYLGRGRHCAAANCPSRQYDIVDDAKVPTGISFFKFPDLKDKGVVIQWCNLIRRRNNYDGFVVSDATRVCEKHFLSDTIYRPPGGTRVRLIGDSKPLLHSWNNFTLSPKKKRKTPTLRDSSLLITSSRKKLLLGEAAERSIEAEQEVPDVEEEDTYFVIDAMKDASISQEDDVMIVDEAIPLTAGDSEKVKLLEKEVEDLQKKVAELEKSLKESEERERKLSMKLNSIELPIIEQVLSDNDTCNHYTGFPSIPRMRTLFDFMDAGENGENVILYQNQGKKETGVGRPRSLSAFQSFLLTLLRLRRGYDIMHLSFLFKVNDTTVSNTIITWINYIYVKLGSIPIWPTMQHVARRMPESMKNKFPYIKVIIDCVEFRVETASSLVLHKMFYSDYKSHTTVKCLVGICPGGGFSFISSVFPGSISDKDITVRSGLLNPSLWNSGEGIMADRGFTIRDYTDNLNIKLVIPAFLQGRDQLSEEEVIITQQIASERIHVERMIQRLKTYHIFDRVIPLSMMGSLNQIITVCALLANFQDPIIAPQPPVK